MGEVLRLKRMRRSSSADVAAQVEADAVAAAEAEEEEAIRERVGAELAYYSQSPGGSSGTITLPAPHGWTAADLEHAASIGQLLRTFVHSSNRSLPRPIHELVVMIMLLVVYSIAYS